MSICAVQWCIGVPQPEAQYCAVHQKDAKLRTLLPESASDKPRAHVDDCDWCGGSGECESCEGEGTHYCEHSGCHDEHDCGNCDGTGKCPDCENERDNDEPKSWPAQYLAWAMDTGWQPWQRPSPWNEE